MKSHTKLGPVICRYIGSYIEGMGWESIRGWDGNSRAGDVNRCHVDTTNHGLLNGGKLTAYFERVFLFERGGGEVVGKIHHLTPIGCFLYESCICQEIGDFLKYHEIHS